MKILLTGATGFIGNSLCRRLNQEGHELHILTRNAEKARQRAGVAATYFDWNPIAGRSPENSIEGVDGVIHLLGEPIGDRRWSTREKKEIFNSRVIGTRNLVAGLSASQLRFFFSASAIGIYGNRGEEILSEDSHVSTNPNDFLSKVCLAWEQEAVSFQNSAQKVFLRTGVVLGKNGGALKKMLPVFKMGFGAKLGSGKQWMSWIHLEDWVDIILFCIKNPEITGPVNLVSPNPVKNNEFARTLGKVLHRPLFMSVPEVALKLGLGEMSQILLDSQRVVPKKLIDKGYAFRFPDLESALESIILRA